MFNKSIPALSTTQVLRGQVKATSAKTFICLIGFALLCSVTATASFADVEVPSNQMLEEQIEFIDQEILLLRAELASTNQDQPSLQRYIDQLKELTLVPSFAERLAELEEGLSSLKIIDLAEHKPSDRTNFGVVQEGDQVVVLLPLSGDYAVAGQAILEGLQTAWPFNREFTIVDSTKYSSMYALWEFVKFYQPDFIIGPLAKHDIRAWQSLDVRTPTLYLNQLDTYKLNERGLSPNKALGLIQLNAFINALALERTLVLVDSNESAKELQVEFEQAWLREGAAGSYKVESIDSGVHQTMRTALNVDDSYARKHWVQRTIGSELEFEPRARQDFDGVVSLTSMSSAIQAKPILNFYHLNRTASLWYPTLYPTADELQSQRNNFQQTYAFLPPYLTQLTDSPNEDSLTAPQSGLFYALGLLAAEAVNKPRLNLAHQALAESALGTLITNKEGRLTILPHLFWLDDRQVQPVQDYQYPFY